MLEQGKRMRSPSPVEEGVAETMRGQLTAVPQSPSPCTIGGKEEVEIYNEVKPRKERGVEV